MEVPANRRPAVSSVPKGGATATSRSAGRPRCVLSADSKRSASALVPCIFQLPTMSERRIAIPYSLRPIYKVTSRIRLEKPHSLSYHDNTLTKLLSITLVNAKSKMNEYGVPLKSTETNFSFYSHRFPGPKNKNSYIFSSALHSQGKSSSQKTVILIRRGFVPVN